MKANYVKCLIHLEIKIILLTGVRTGEIRLAQWHQCNFEQSLWTILPEHSKGAITVKIHLSELTKMMLPSPIDSAKLNAFAMAQAEVESELLKNRIMTYHNIYENLNDQQKTQSMKILNQ